MAYYTCEKCGEDFQRPGNKKYKFCSRTCYGKSKRKPPAKRECKTCGKQFIIPYKTSQRRYCSRKCAHKSYFKSVERKCLACGKKFFTRPSQRGKYCSPKCFYQRNTGKSKRYSWTKYKKIYIKGKGTIWEHRHVMEENIGRKLESWEQVHHIDGNPKNNDPKNLMLIVPREHTTYTILQKTIRKLRKENKRLKEELSNYR